MSIPVTAIQRSIPALAPYTTLLRLLTEKDALATPLQFDDFPFHRWERTLPISPVLADEIDELIAKVNPFQFPHNVFSHKCPAYALQLVFYAREVRVTLCDFSHGYGGDALCAVEDDYPSMIPTNEQIKRARRILAMSVPQETPQ